MPITRTRKLRRPERALGQRDEGQRAALAVVVGAQQDEHVFDRDGEDQRPEEERQDADHQLAGHGRAAMWPPAAAIGLAHGVERAGADIAVDDADGAEREGPETALAWPPDRRRLRRGGIGVPGGDGLLFCHVRFFADGPRTARVRPLVRATEGRPLSGDARGRSLPARRAP